MKRPRNQEDEIRGQSRMLAERLQKLLVAIGHVASLRDPIGASASSASVELTGPQCHVLMWLGVHPDLPMSKLAEFMHCSGATCTGIADRLERDGFVERVRGAEDRRKVTLRLTGEGRERAERIREGVVARMAQFLGLLEVEDRQALLAILERALATAMNRVQVAGHPHPAVAAPEPTKNGGRDLPGHQAAGEKRAEVTGTRRGRSDNHSQAFARRKAARQGSAR
jgi:DNA-binding MarR family transcriptional regulator